MITTQTSRRYRFLFHHTHSLCLFNGTEVHRTLQLWKGDDVFEENNHRTSIATSHSNRNKNASDYF